jgi:hypothetical protein
MDRHRKRISILAAILVVSMLLSILSAIFMNDGMLEHSTEETVIENSVEIAEALT